MKTSTLELLGERGWPREKVRRKLDEIQAKRDEISQQFTKTATSLEVGGQFFLTALTLLRGPQAFYR